MSLTRTEIEASSAKRPYSTFEDVTTAHTRLVNTFASGKTKSLRWRLWQLKQFWWMINDNEEAICRVGAMDVNRPDFESLIVESNTMKFQIMDHIEHLEEWTADDPVPEVDFVLRTLGNARVRKEPRGVALILGAWNTPIHITLGPAVAAVAAGCCVLIKPSEVAVAAQNLMADLVAKYLDPEAIQLVTGGVPETTKILELKFGHIWQVGSTKIGKVVAAAAAKTLTPTVLELGGLGPAVVTGKVDPDLAAKRVAWGKTINGGQLCTSVNHVFVDPSIYDEFVKRLVYWTEKFAGGENGLQQVCSIINEAHYRRLSGLLEKTKGKVYQPHKSIEARNIFAPTVVSDVRPDDSLLSEEIFGPVLPVLKATFQEAIKDINSRPHSLGLYILSNDRSEINYILDHTQSGGVTVNDITMHSTIPGAPFGGVGESGMGAFHGKHGFLAFTHLRTVLEIPFWIDRLMGWRYPPYAMKNRNKLNPATNKWGFRRGETMEDQVIGRTNTWTWITVGAAVAVAGTLGARVGGRETLECLVSAVQSAFR